MTRYLRQNSKANHGRPPISLLGPLKVILDGVPVVISKPRRHVRFWPNLAMEANQPLPARVSGRDALARPARRRCTGQPPPYPWRPPRDPWRARISPRFLSITRRMIQLNPAADLWMDPPFHWIDRWFDPRHKTPIERLEEAVTSIELLPGRPQPTRQRQLPRMGPAQTRTVSIPMC